jgi:hypothetical protein
MFIRFSPRVTEASLEVDRSVVLLDFVDGIEDVSSELPVDDRPGVPPLFTIGEKVTSFRTFRCAASLELTKEFLAYVICATNSAFTLASSWAASSG